MGNSICRFVPAKNYTGNIKTVHFVYETDFPSMAQPFIRPIYYVHLVTGGQAVLKLNGTTHPLRRGCLFFFFPGVPYEIEGDGAFRYIYISFMGSCVPTLLENLHITMERPVYEALGFLIEFWQTSIARINALNANILAESVLLHTLSYISDDGSAPPLKNDSEKLFELIVDYVDSHYRDADITLKKVADVFNYTEKYLSHLFKKNMSIGFNSYVNNLRIQHAYELIAQRETSVARIAARCGYVDPLYFSKVFKKQTGASPTEYIKNGRNTDRG